MFLSDQERGGHILNVVFFIFIIFLGESQKLLR